MNAPIAEPTIFGLPLFLMFVLAFLMNFLIARFFTIQLIKGGFVTKHPIIFFKRKRKVVKVANTKEKTLEFQKCLITWFVPIVGALCMIGLWLICICGRFIRTVSHRLFLNHI